MSIQFFFFFLSFFLLIGDDQTKRRFAFETRITGSEKGAGNHRETNNPGIWPQKQWRSLEILYVSATSPVKGGRKELAELKGTMFNPTLQPPAVESFDEV